MRLQHHWWLNTIYQALSRLHVFHTVYMCYQGARIVKMGVVGLKFISACVNSQVVMVATEENQYYISVKLNLYSVLFSSTLDEVFEIIHIQFV